MPQIINSYTLYTNYYYFLARFLHTCSYVFENTNSVPAKYFRLSLLFYLFPPLYYPTFSSCPLWSCWSIANVCKNWLVPSFFCLFFLSFFSFYSFLLFFLILLRIPPFRPSFQILPSTLLVAQERSAHIPRTRKNKVCVCCVWPPYPHPVLLFVLIISIIFIMFRFVRSFVRHEITVPILKASSVFYYYFLFTLCFRIRIIISLRW